MPGGAWLTAQLAAGLGRANRPQTKVATHALCNITPSKSDRGSRRSKGFDRLVALPFREISARLAVCLMVAALCVATFSDERSSSAQQLNTFRTSFSQQLSTASPAPRRFEYLWNEAENMRGIATDARHSSTVGRESMLKSDCAVGSGSSKRASGRMNGCLKSPAALMMKPSSCKSRRAMCASSSLF